MALSEGFAWSIPVAAWHYEGAKGTERKVRVEHEQGHVWHLEGEAGAERLVRVEGPTGASTSDADEAISQQLVGLSLADAESAARKSVRRLERRTCSLCGAVSQTTLRRCPCGDVRYCNKECQKADWRAHKLVCSALARGSS